MSARWTAGVSLCAVTSLAGCGGNEVLRSARGILDTNPDAAYGSLRTEVEKNPNDRDVVRVFVSAALRTGHDAEAIAALERIEARGESDSTWAATVREEAWTEVFRPVRDVLDTLALASPADRRAAETATARASALAPFVAGNDAASAIFALEDGRHEDAAELFARAIEKATERPATRPAVAVALRRGAAAVAKAGDLERAILWGRAAVELAPDDVRASYDLGVHLHQAGDRARDPERFEEAVAQFERVLGQLPRDVDARYNLALASYRLGDAARAASELEVLMAVDPYQGPAHLLSARLALAAGDSTRARTHVAAMRALGGEEVPVPSSALSVSDIAGREGRKRFVLTGAPARIFRLREDPARSLEVWFFPSTGRVVAFGGGRLIGEVRVGDERDPGRVDPDDAAS